VARAESHRARGRGPPLAGALLLGLVLGSTGGARAAPALDDLVGGHCRARAETTTLRARFVQTRSFAALGEEERSEGVLYYRRPDSLRWEYAEPAPSWTVIRGRRGWAVFPAIRQVQTFDLGGSRVDGLLSVVGFAACGPGFREGFDVALGAGAGDGRPVLALTPRRPELAAAFDRIELALDPRDLLPRRVVLHETGGDTVQLEFQDLRRKVPLDPALFEFTTPKHYVVVP
jgi:outer membrane lipoprotein carrier protein